MKYLVSLLLICPVFVFAGGLRISNLRCENCVDQVGVESAKPLLSWQLKSEVRNVIQRNYRILVADDSMLLIRNIGNVWDTKAVPGSSSINIPYAGKKLVPTKKYYWKVPVADNKTNGEWSPVAYWMMGLQTAADWKHAKWIAYESLPDSNVILPFAHGRGKKESGAGRNILPLIRKDFSIGKPVKKALFYISGLGQFDMHVNGKKVGDHFLDPGWTMYDKHALYVTFDLAGQI